MKTVTISVPEISCEHCKKSIEGALTGQTGINSAIVQIQKKTVDVIYDETKTTLENIESLIEDQGYDIKK